MVRANRITSFLTDTTIESTKEESGQQEGDALTLTTRHDSSRPACLTPAILLQLSTIINPNFTNGELKPDSEYSMNKSAGFQVQAPYSVHNDMVDFFKGIR